MLKKNRKMEKNLDTNVGKISDDIDLAIKAAVKVPTYDIVPGIFTEIIGNFLSDFGAQFELLNKIFGALTNHSLGDEIIEFRVY